MTFITDIIRNENGRAWKIMGTICMAWCFYALDGSAISLMITNEAFLREFNIDADRLGAFNTLPIAGAAIGTIGLAGFMNRRFGRKKSFQMATSTLMLGVVLQILPTNYGALLFGRILVGVGGDWNGITLGLYVSEVAPAASRGGMLIGAQQFAGQLIGIIGGWIIYGFSYLPANKGYSWRVANSLQFIPGIIFVLMVFYLPESPRWLAMKHKEDDGPMLKAISELTGKDVEHEDVVTKAKSIRTYQRWEASHEKTHLFNFFTDLRLFKRMCMCMCAFSFNVLCGVQTLGLYAVIIYQSLGLTTQQKSLLLNSCLAVVYCIGALISALIIDKIGRRASIISGLAVITVCQACIAGLTIGFEGQNNQVANGWIIFFITAAIFSYWALLTGAVGIYGNECLPTQAREMGVGMANLVPIFVGFTVANRWPTAVQNIGAKSYLILLSLCICALILAVIFIRETKCIELERLDVAFGENDHLEEEEEKQVAAAAQENAAAIEEKRDSLTHDNASEKGTNAGGSKTESINKEDDKPTRVETSDEIDSMPKLGTQGQRK